MQVEKRDGLERDAGKEVRKEQAGRVQHDCSFSWPFLPSSVNQTAVHALRPN